MINLTEIIKIRREYYEKVCNLGEMEKFLERQKSLKSIQE